MTYRLYEQDLKAELPDVRYGPIPRIGECVSINDIIYIVMQVLYHDTNGVWVYIISQESYIRKTNSSRKR